MSIWRFARHLPAVSKSNWITLGEGNTPLIPSMRIGPSIGMPNLWFKLEQANPSGSYKDRFAACAISHMKQTGISRCIATSSGNTGSALAAYCARASIACEIAIVETAPLGKLSQMLAYGAKLYQVRGFGTDPTITARTFDHVLEQGKSADAMTQISAFTYSPIGMAGVQTISHELAEQSPDPIDHVFCPAGGGGLTLAVARGFRQLSETGPRIECVQPVGNATIATPLREGRDKAREVNCTSNISGLQVANVIDGHHVIAACRDSHGTGHTVTDDQTYAVQARLAHEEGIFSEPAGAVALGGLLNAAANGEVDRHDRVVCLVTGSGFKDAESIDRLNRHAECPILDLSEVTSLND